MKTHVISGVSSGIGRGIADRLIARGDKVIAMVRHESSAQHFNQKIICDFRHPESVKAALLNFSDPVDSFINCAAIAIGKSVLTSSPAEISNVLSVNVISPMVASAELVRNIRVGGAIVFFSSQSAYRGGFDDAYNVSKGGINTFIKSLALKVAPKIRVFGIAPGITLNTRMTQDRRQDDLASIRETIPLRRFADVAELAELTESLLGSAGAYITGAVIDVNGGNYLR